ncbi:unnamed protein product [Lepeophtheirus salmonis]|uniref:(salmon louse) hypothetical protein n=1 Tax=Lepeophtheirus salmonis TaxID=72036 RepID=A0A7R8D1Y0_LEPSM|nr:unnamed protein product [Lepeophtheirus salmonis]CAF3000160.1 unnamed protein product [Lepeophtheirus salmonis]
MYQRQIQNGQYLNRKTKKNKKRKKMALESMKRTDEIGLLGKLIPRFPGTKFSSRGDSLKAIFYLHQLESEIKQCFKTTATIISEIWCKANIPIMTPNRFIDKFRKLPQEYYNLRKSKKTDQPERPDSMTGEAKNGLLEKKPKEKGWRRNNGTVINGLKNNVRQHQQLLPRYTLPFFSLIGHNVEDLALAQVP